MSERGHYGDEQRRYALPPPYSLTGDPGGFSLPDLPRDSARIGVALGIGTLIGILIGTKVTFHLPVRKRR